MYESRFGITGPPFQLSPDPSFYFDSRGHHRALTELRRGLAEEAGFVVVSGEIGAGKTTIVRTLLAELDPAALAVAHVVSTQLNAEELLTAASIGFGIHSTKTPSDIDLVARLHDFLAGLVGEGRRAVLIVDEAQNLHLDAFERLATLGTDETGRRLPLTICLVGQPELRTIIESADLARMRPRVTVSSHLGPIQADETGAYISHRLRKVGWNGSPSFEPGAFEEVFRWTEGVPRRINLLCNRLMLSRFLAGKMQIDVATVVETARDLRTEMGEPDAEPAVRSGTRSPRAPSPTLDEVSPEETTDTAAVGTSEVHTPLDLPKREGLLLCVVADHSDHIKAGALMRAMSARPELQAARLVRVHDNEALNLNRAVFEGLDVLDGMISLGIPEGLDPHRRDSLAGIFESVVDRVSPAAVIVFDGSVAAFTCAAVASRRSVPVVHVGAGLREGEALAPGGDTRRPTDRLADLLYTTDTLASETLANEGIPFEFVHCAGNLLVDAMQAAMRQPLSAQSGHASASVVEPYLGGRNGYALVVLNKPVNIGDRPSLMSLLATLREASRDIPLVWPMHRSVTKQLRHFRLDNIGVGERITCIPAPAYPDYLALLRHATCVLTDSWGAQEEATALGVPCLTLGRYPERTITVTTGSNVVVGNSRALVARTLWECIFNGGRKGTVPELWDGRAGSRIASYLAAWLPTEPTEVRQHL